MEALSSLLVFSILAGLLFLSFSIVLLAMNIKLKNKNKKLLKDQKIKDDELAEHKQAYSSNLNKSESDKFKLAEAGLNILEAKEEADSEKELLEAANIALIKREKEIQKQLEINDAQKFQIAECTVNIMEQKEEIEYQRDKVKLINEEITSSIHYASRIQKAILPEHDFISELLQNCFILFRPKDIVSGDFYWFTKCRDQVIVVAADCTGHGVPGAFMSMLGIAFLNEIVIKEDVKEVNQILNRLREHVVIALHQKGHKGEQKDGMDIVICSINNNTNVLSFAGANNPLYLVRESSLPAIECERELHTDNYSLYEIKGDNMPIGIYSIMNEFSCHEITLENGDWLYLISDGYADQFGGAKGKKFMYKPLREMLLNNCRLSAKIQKEQLENTLDEWMNYPNDSGRKYNQVDDITIIGIQV